MAETPNDELAAIVVGALVAEGLIPAAKQPDLLAKLSAGTMKEADWRLIVEQAITDPAEEGTDGRHA